MNAVIQFIKSVLVLAFHLGAAGTLVEATGCIGQEAAKAHQLGSVSFRWLKHQLLQ